MAEESSVSAEPQDLAIVGAILAVLGIAALAFVHSMRPPTSPDDVLRALVKGQQSMLQPEAYYMLLILATCVVVAGVWMFFANYRRGPQPG